MSGEHDVPRSVPGIWQRLWRRHAANPRAAVGAIDRLADRYLDPSRRFGRSDDLERQALCEAHPEAARRWAKRLALHRAMVGTAGERSGLEDRRTLSLVMEQVEVRPARRWWLALPIVVMAALVLVVVMEPPSQSDWVAVRGGEASFFEPRVGLGVGGIDAAGSEYEVIASGAVEAGDWLRFSYTNERSDLGWLFVVALRGDGVVWLFPLPADGASVPIGPGDRTSLPFESRVPEAGMDGAGELVIMSLFTATPLTVDAMRSALEALPSGLTTRLVPRRRHSDLRLPVASRRSPSASREPDDRIGAAPQAPPALGGPSASAPSQTDRIDGAEALDSGLFELEVHLRVRLGLAATDVVQVVNTRIAPRTSPSDPGGTTAPTTPNDHHGPREEAP